jgi:hypothetical protein
MQLTIRELGGEIWGEWETRRGGFPPFDTPCEDWELFHRYLDLSLAVIARHEGMQIINDADLPVVPLPTLDQAP